MARTAHLYLKTEQGVAGPFSAYRLHEMVRRGRISSGTQVSPDGIRWLDAGRIRGLFGAAPAPALEPATDPVVPVPAVRPELKRIATSVDNATRLLHRVFQPSVMLAILTALVTVFCGVYALGRFYAPAASVLILFCVAILPAGLVSAAAGQMAGNLAIRILTRLSDAERRCLALHVPYSHTPERWPHYLCNWIYGGDWLRRAEREEIVPYARAFVTGMPTRSIEEELDIWSELLTRTRSHDGRGIEVGQAVRELAHLERLPEWTRDVEAGTTLPQLERRLGRVGRDWAACLFRRAVTRMPELGGPDEPLDHLAFEFYYCMLSDGREALVVIIRRNSRAAAARRHAEAAAA